MPAVSGAPADEGARMAHREQRARLVALDASPGGAHAARPLGYAARERGGELAAPAAVHAEAAALWGRVAAGESAELAQAAAVLERSAARAGMAAETVEAASLAALGHERCGALDAALQQARRAMRMARSEGLPEAEHLAALVLARMRRRANQAHLAARILAALRRYALPEWHAWIDWELALATGGEGLRMLGAELAGAQPPPHANEASPAAALGAWLQAAARGDRAGFEACGGALRRTVQGFAPALADVTEARWAIDADAELARDADTPAGSATSAWRQGASDVLPAGAAGLAGAPAPGVAAADAEATVCVLARPERARGARLLGVGGALFVPGGVALAAAPAKHARTGALVAALALAGEAGLEEPEAFAAAYGFAYVPERHRDTFHVAIHRARAHVEAVARIERGEGRLQLRVAQATLFADPRCARPLADQVLRCIAAEGRIGARRVGEVLGISLRSAQGALEQLLEDGSCQRVRSGRAVEYAVEDTTFQEPTEHRRRSD